MVVVFIAAIGECAQQTTQVPLVIDDGSALMQPTRCMVTRAPTDNGEYESKCIESAHRNGSDESWLGEFIRENFVDKAIRIAFNRLFGLDDYGH